MRAPRYDEEILALLSENTRLTPIARALNRDPSNVRRALVLLTRKGLVRQHGVHWNLTAKGRQELKDQKFKDQKRPTPPSKTKNVTAERVKTRLHHLTIAVCHRMDEFTWRNNFQGMMKRVRVPTLNEEFHFQFTRKAVQFTLAMPASDNLISDVSATHMKVVKIVRFLTRRYKVRLVRPSDLGIKKLYSELAYLKTSWAHKEVGSGRRIWLYNWEDEGKPRVLFDKSLNSAELESVGVTVDDDAIETAHFLKHLYEGGVRSAFEEVEAMKAYVPQIHKALTEVLAQSGVRAPELSPQAKRTKERYDALMRDESLRVWFHRATLEEQNKYLRLPEVKK